MAIGTDNFNRSNETPITGWTVLMNGALSVVSNQLTATSGGSQDRVSYNNSVTPGNDQYSQALCVSSSDSGPACRITETDNCYFLDPPFSLIGKFVNGSYSQVLALQYGTVNGSTARIEAEGTTLRAKRNGSEVSGSPTTDSSLSSGRVGMFIFVSADTWDDWEGGDLNDGTRRRNTIIAKNKPHLYELFLSLLFLIRTRRTGSK